MSAAIPEAAGPPCDFCADFPAVMSLMNLQDWSQQKACPACAVPFLRSVADAIAGVPDPAAAPVDVSADYDQDQTSVDVPGEPCPLCGAMVPLAEIPAHVQQHADGELPVDGDESAGPTAAGTVTGQTAAAPTGNAANSDPARPDPLTSAVVRSTHGHRKAKGATGGPAPEGGETQ